MLAQRKTGCQMKFVTARRALRPRNGQMFENKHESHINFFVLFFKLSPALASEVCRQVLH